MMKLMAFITPEDVVKKVVLNHRLAVNQLTDVWDVRSHKNLHFAAPSSL
jgi:hypothetical protein